MKEKCVSLLLLSDNQKRREKFSSICQETDLHLLDAEKLPEARLPARTILIVDAGISFRKMQKLLATYREHFPDLPTALWTDGNEDKIASIYTENDFDYLLFDPISRERLNVLEAQFSHCMLKKHEMELANEEAVLKLDYYRDLLDNGTEAVVVLNEDFKIDYCNKMLSELLNKDSGSLIGKNMQKYLEDGFKVLHHVYQKLTLGKEVRGYRVSIKNPQENLIDVNLNANFLYSAAGYVKGVILTMENRTINDIAFNQLLRREKFSVIKYLSFALAHEIHNPVNILMGRLQLMTQTMPEASKRSMEIVHKQIDRIDAVIGQLRKFNHNKEDSIPEVFGLIGFLEDFLDNKKETSALKFKLKYQKKSQDILIQGNKNQFTDGFTYLFRTLDNILKPENAVHIHCNLRFPSNQPPCLELQINIPDTSIPDNFFETFETVEHSRHSTLDAALASTIFTAFGSRLFIDSPDSGEKLLKLQFNVAGVRGFQQELDLDEVGGDVPKDHPFFLPMEDKAG